MMTTMLFLASQLIPLLGSSQQNYENAPPTIERIRQLAGCPEQLCHLYLLDYGAAAFPAYEAILSDPKSDPLEITGIFSVLIEVKAPKAEFYKLVVPYLSHKYTSVRYTATCLMKQIGTLEEGSALVALLSDKDQMTAYEAATALAKTGGKREVIAMDVWLNGGVAHRDDAELMTHVKKCRDELEKRLKEKEMPKDGKK